MKDSYGQHKKCFGDCDKCLPASSTTVDSKNELNALTIRM